MDEEMNDTEVIAPGGTDGTRRDVAHDGTRRIE